MEPYGSQESKRWWGDDFLEKYAFALDKRHNINLEKVCEKISEKFPDQDAVSSKIVSKSAK